MVYYQRGVLLEDDESNGLERGMETLEIANQDKETGLTWPEAFVLQSHYTSWPTQSVKDWAQVSKWLSTHCPSLCGFETPIDTLMQWVSRIESNGFGLWAGNKAESCMGRGLFPLASFFNHSCDPNCQVTQTLRQLDVETLREVQKGASVLHNLYGASSQFKNRHRGGTLHLIH
jgi:hypothetical protein